MQDRYAGDIGDFAKFAILRGLTKGTPLRIGLVWYLTSHPGDPVGDGRHTKYLEPTRRNQELYRSCDPELYELLGRLVRSGDRSVAAYQPLEILPKGTVYYDVPLVFEASTNQSERATLRGSWVRQSLRDTSDCDVVMFDPDNGLEVQSATKYVAKGPKYVFFDELIDFATRGQTIIVYQHAIRAGTLADQTSRRLAQLQERLQLRTKPFALLWRPTSARAFLVAPSVEHESLLQSRTETLLASPLGRHVQLQQI